MESQRLKNRLKDLREDRDLTQDQLVAILKINKTTYTRYEQGISDMPLADRDKNNSFCQSAKTYVSCTPVPIRRVSPALQPRY